MKVFIKDPSGQTYTHYVEDSNLVADLKDQVAEGVEIDAEELTLQFGIRTLQNEEFLGDCLEDEACITMHMSLDGGKKKKKKRKAFTSPKRVAHKHRKRPKALLEYFTVEQDKVKRLKQESPNCSGAYMADHADRYTCGKTGTMFYKLTADGKRLPIPKNQAKKAEVKKEEVKKAAKKKAPKK